MFMLVEGIVLLRSRQGVFREAKLARLNSELYAITPGGYVLLYGDKSTSNPQLSWTEMEGVADHHPGKLGRLTLVK